MDGEDVNQKDPYEEMLDKMSELLQFIQNNASKPIDEKTLSPEVYEKLEKIQKGINNFKQLSDQLVELSDVSREEMKLRLLGLSSEISPQAKRMIEKGDKIKFQAEKMRQELHLTQDIIPAEDSLMSAPEIKKDPTQDKKIGKRRRRKFKQFGEDSRKPF